MTQLQINKTWNDRMTGGVINHFFENMEEKRVLMTQYEENQSIRKRKNVLDEMQRYRLFFDVNVVKQ